MKKLALALALAAAFAAQATGSDIIPAVAQEKTAAGSFRLPQRPKVWIESGDASDNTRLSKAVKAFLPGAVFVKNGNKADIRLQYHPAVGVGNVREGYELTVGPKGIGIEAESGAGLFYGLQTLRGLKETEGDVLGARTVSDSPRFGYRGLMLDVSRNFQDVDFVKKQLDAMARLKLNKFHFHLTDGAGWRMEIKRYPKLTQQAAWRRGATWKDWNAQGNGYASEGDPEASGGYYTQEQLRDIVAYAADRYITVIPEIEMPSHSEEVLSAYPELLCVGAGDHKSDFCPGNPLTYEFLENVLEEVLDVFPSQYIHIGGDEAPKTAWKDCTRCDSLMKAAGLENVEQLQSHLIHHMDQWMTAHGRDLLGWDEIMEGGLAPGAAVMSWRGTAGGEKAAAAGHKVVMTPGRYCYLDGYQDAPATQPEAIGGYLPLELAYSYEPVPESLRGTANEKFIYGLQGNLFTEYVATPEHAEYMIWPRMFAIAERGWSPAGRRDYTDFRRRAVGMADRLREEGYNPFDLNKEAGNRPQTKTADSHLAVGKKVEYVKKPWSSYPANGELTLTDGLHGGWNYNDQRWQAFFDMDVVVDLGEVTDIKHVDADFMQICGPGVWMPAKVEILVSDDNETFRPVATIEHKVEKSDLVEFKNFGWDGKERARYVRYRAQPDREMGGVLFTDEIVVR